jgi:hypothetical protein
MQQQTWGNGHLPFLAVGRVKERAGKASDVPYGGDAVAMGARINSFTILELHPIRNREQQHHHFLIKIL